MPTITITRSKVKRGYVVSDASGRYAAQGGGRYYGYDPATDGHAVTQTLAEIREELDAGYASHDLPTAWPRGRDQIAVTAQPC